MNTGAFQQPKIGTVFALACSLVTLLMFGFFPSTGGSTLNIHAEHLQIAQQNQQASTGSASAATQTTLPPALQGDRTKRYDVVFTPPENPTPDSPTHLQFQVVDASSGSPVELFSRPYEQPLHLIIVDEQLSYFTHVHPAEDRSRFSIDATLPHAGRYRLYLDFQPFGGIEQQFAFTLDAGGSITSPNQKPDTILSKAVDGYSITLATDDWQADKLTTGEQTFRFTVSDSTGRPVTTLKPYLNTFGHLVMVSESSHAYVHVHPTQFLTPGQQAVGGPEVDFLPIGLYSPIKPGIYRVFAQFNPDDHLVTADFTINVR